MDWRHRAACRDEDPELFFPVTDIGPGAKQVDEAKSICATCPVRERCLRFALDNGLTYGVFGGMTEQDRADLVRRSAHAA
ncbi:MAG: WhiB family transcriptional regulator [Actinophytocola sp.]|nr:WhiB family transcriptional regulator [Actinophytocola sp.]